MQKADWRGAGHLPGGRASSWLLMLVHRRAVDLVRRSERRRTDVLDDVPDAVGDSVEDIGWLRLERERVQAALKVLPDAERESIELAYYGGFSQSEIAERIGQPLGTIKSRTFSGLRRLRELLGDGALEREWDPSSFTSSATRTPRHSTRTSGRFEPPTTCPACRATSRRSPRPPLRWLAACARIRPHGPRGHPASRGRGSAARRRPAVPAASRRSRALGGTRSRCRSGHRPRPLGGKPAREARPAARQRDPRRSAGVVVAPQGGGR